MNMIYHRAVSAPEEIKALYPVTPEIAATVAGRIETLQAIFRGEDPRLLLIIGPCSADNEEAVLDYIGRLRRVQEAVAERIFIVPRIYTGKPRTTGEGYMGPLHQPDPEARTDMMKGLLAVRKMHMRAVAETGFSCADEMLYPENHSYLDDLLAYVAVGARSVENQQHRLTASGLEVPVGMKNPTGGDVSVMMNAILAAQRPHTFLYRGMEAETPGNPYAHAILRGYTDKHGTPMSNYHYEDLARLSALYAKMGLQNPSVIVDCNHANSGKNPLEQPRILREVLSCRRWNGDVAHLVKGFMVESYIEDGAQKIGEGVYGKSITDACLGWEKTERMIYDMAEAL